MNCIKVVFDISSVLIESDSIIDDHVRSSLKLNELVIRVDTDSKFHLMVMLLSEYVSQRRQDHELLDKQFL